MGAVESAHVYIVCASVYNKCPYLQMGCISYADIDVMKCVFPIDLNCVFRVGSVMSFKDDFAVYLKLTQHCKSTILQFLEKEKIT